MSNALEAETPTRGRAWRRLSDPGIISMPTLLISTAIFAVEAGVAVLDNAYTPLTAVVYLAVTQLVLFSVLFAARALYLRRPFALRHPSVLVLTVVIASFVSVIMGQTGVLFTQPPGEEPLIIGADAFISRVLVVLVVGSVVAAFADYRSVITELNTTQQQLLLTRAAGSEALMEQRSEVITRVQSLVTDSLREVHGESADKASQVIASVAENIVRPLSHDLATQPPVFSPVRVQERSDHTWRSVLQDVTAAPLISPFWMAFVVTIISIRFTVTAPPETLETQGELPTGVTVQTGSLLQSLLLLAAIFLTVFLASSLVRRVLQRRLPPLSVGRRLLVLALGVLVILVAVQVTFGAYYLLFSPSETRMSLVATLIASIPVVGIAVIMGVTRIVTDNWRRTAQLLKRRNDDLAWEVARIKDTLWQQRRELARALHGPMQSAMRAASRQFQDVPTGDDMRLREVSAQVARDIDAALQRIFDPHNTQIDIAEHCRNVQRTWDGLCAVRAEIDPHSESTLARDPVCAAAVADIVTEAVANAALHARAQEVAISLTVEQDRYLIVQVSDDGQAPSVPTEPGLGSKMLDEVCLSWELALDEEGGALLRAVLPVQIA